MRLAIEPPARRMAANLANDERLGYLGGVVIIVVFIAALAIAFDVVVFPPSL